MAYEPSQHTDQGLQAFVVKLSLCEREVICCFPQPLLACCAILAVYRSLVVASPHQVSVWSLIKEVFMGMNQCIYDPLAQSLDQL